MYWCTQNTLKNFKNVPSVSRLLLSLLYVRLMGLLAYCQISKQYTGQNVHLNVSDCQNISPWKSMSRYILLAINHSIITIFSNLKITSGVKETEYCDRLYRLAFLN